ncbi:MAG: GGDEF domain-containing protein [Candidatus Acidiferrum sp.]
MSSDEIKLGYLLLTFLRSFTQNRPANKFNVIGRSGRGEFEIWLNKDVPPHEKQSLIWLWDELKRARLINATGTDLVNPDDWVIASPKGQTISESEFAAIFTDELRERTGTEKLVDAVTGIFQRGELDADLAKFGDRKGDDPPVSFVMADLDHFKTFNDNYGHAAGDEVLRAVAKKIATVVRGKGETYRYGGEEISVVLPNHSVEEATAVAERIRNEIASIRIASLPDCSVTASLGVATIPETSETVETIVLDADRAMYEAKHSGRNRVRAADKQHSGLRVQPKAAGKPNNELFRVSFQTQSQGILPTTTVKVMRVIGSIENISPSRRIREYVCTLSVPASCLTYNSAVYPSEIKARLEGYRSFRSTEKNHARVPIYQGDRFQIISVDIAVDHLTESERQKCLEMEVIATAEGDDEVAETRKTVAQLMGV